MKMYFCLKCSHFSEKNMHINYGKTLSTVPRRFFCKKCECFSHDLDLNHSRVGCLNVYLDSSKVSQTEEAASYINLPKYLPFLLH